MKDQIYHTIVDPYSILKRVDFPSSEFDLLYIITISKPQVKVYVQGRKVAN